MSARTTKYKNFYQAQFSLAKKSCDFYYIARLLGEQNEMINLALQCNATCTIFLVSLLRLIFVKTKWHRIIIVLKIARNE